MTNIRFLDRRGIECKILRIGKENGIQCYYYCYYKPNAENRRATAVISIDGYNKLKKLQLITMFIATIV